MIVPIISVIANKYLIIIVLVCELFTNTGSFDARKGIVHFFILNIGAVKLYKLLNISISVIQQKLYNKRLW